MIKATTGLASRLAQETSWQAVKMQHGVSGGSFASHAKACTLRMDLRELCRLRVAFR